MNIKIINLISILICAGFFVFSINFVFAEGETADANYGLTETVKRAEVLPNSQANVSTIIGQIIGVALSFVGVLFFILVVYGGFLWMTARGNEDQVGKAVSIITQASIGLVIVATAYLITRFVGETVLNSLIAPKQ